MPCHIIMIMCTREPVRVVADPARKNEAAPRPRPSQEVVYWQTLRGRGSSIFHRTTEHRLRAVHSHLSIRQFSKLLQAVVRLFRVSCAFEATTIKGSHGTVNTACHWQGSDWTAEEHAAAHMDSQTFPHYCLRLSTVEYRSGQKSPEAALPRSGVNPPPDKLQQRLPEPRLAPTL